MEYTKNNIEQLTAWQRFLFNTFVPRTYARNHFDSSMEKYWFYIAFFLFGVSFAGWAFLPIFKITFILIAVGYILFSPFYFIKLANKLIVLPTLTAFFCVLALHFHWRWGLSIFGFHFEKYICYVFLVGAGLALFRRGWNTIAWKVLDKITQHH